MSSKKTASGFKPETINRVMVKANERRVYYYRRSKIVDGGKAVIDWKECISTGNRKIGRVLNVSIMPIMTCHNCKECMHYCYDIKACAQYPDTVIDARMRNTVLLELDRDEYFARIEKKISRRRKNKFFRWHVAGDIVDIDYLSRMVEVARRHPDFVFWTYTKEYNTVNRYVRTHGKTRADAIPSNLSIMFSLWNGTTMFNPYGFPVFACEMPGYEYPEIAFTCPGNCDVCTSACRGCVAGESAKTALH